MMYTTLRGSAVRVSRASSVSLEGTAALGILTIGASVPYETDRRVVSVRHYIRFSVWTHIVIKEEKALLRLDVMPLELAFGNERRLARHI